jgi:hypothetical protein
MVPGGRPRLGRVREVTYLSGLMTTGAKLEELVKFYML